MNEQTVLEYVTKNAVPTKSGRKCVDGRYLQDENTGMIARAGGDLGYAMILLALSEKKHLTISPEECLDNVFSALRRMDEHFYFHSDSHASSESIGCGHAAKAMDPQLAVAYELDADEIKELVNYAKQRNQKDSEHIHLVPLPGNHAEQAVLVNTGINHTVLSQNDNEMFFIYDKTRDMEFIEKLVEALDLPEISADEFKRMSDIQTTATLHNLALNKPIFEINVDEIPTIKLIGTVE